MREPIMRERVAPGGVVVVEPVGSSRAERRAHGRGQLKVAHHLPRWDKTARLMRRAQGGLHG